MAPTTEARARYARELVEHTMRQFTAARETLENSSSAAKRKPAAHAARDGHRGRLPYGLLTVPQLAILTSTRRCNSWTLLALYTSIVPHPFVPLYIYLSTICSKNPSGISRRGSTVRVFRAANFQTVWERGGRPPAGLIVLSRALNTSTDLNEDRGKMKSNQGTGTDVEPWPQDAKKKPQKEAGTPAVEDPIPNRTGALHVQGTFSIEIRGRRWNRKLSVAKLPWRSVSFPRRSEFRCAPPRSHKVGGRNAAFAEPDSDGLPPGKQSTPTTSSRGALNRYQVLRCRIGAWIPGLCEWALYEATKIDMSVGAEPDPESNGMPPRGRRVFMEWRCGHLSGYCTLVLRPGYVRRIQWTLVTLPSRNLQKSGLQSS
ncbi:hypothetical protein C8R47DRAFT_1077356 [Mycena vitilis]|nr:hypothetical protein C8R47DRAFT_1077356 [Mycena vitilis]